MNAEHPITYFMIPTHGTMAACTAAGLAFADIAHRAHCAGPDAIPLPPRRLCMTSEWPLHTFLEFGALPSAVPCARLHVRQLLWEWGLAALSDTVQLLVSELLTNAINASREMVRRLPVRLWLLSDKARVLVLVWDGDPRQPTRADPTMDDEAGRGLLLAESLSTRWGWHGAGELGGKVAWAAIEAG